MTENFQQLFSQIINTSSSVWQYTLISNDFITIILGRLILSIVVYIIGWKVSRILLSKLKNLYLNKKIKDKNISRWIENFLFYLILFFLTILFFIILGVSPNILSKIWHLSPFSIKDNPIEFGNLLIGIVLFFVGIRVSRYLSIQFREIFLSRAKLELSTKLTLETIARYFLIVLISLFALSIIGIPLTAFTVIGGALAIGVGLGSQNLINNFLSGIVLMTEKPLKVKDIVELENKIGTVEQIGARSTRIKTFDNLRLVIPNSKLLENTLINWSLVDKLLRRKITIGVAYGSPTQKVRELILEAVTQHREVEKNPKPMVLFSDFGDSALIFTALFWTKLRKNKNPLVVDSDIRFKIDELFDREKITIPFPQNDVHFDSAKPINIKVLSTEDPIQKNIK